MRTVGSDDYDDGNDDDDDEDTKLMNWTSQTPNNLELA